MTVAGLLLPLWVCLPDCKDKEPARPVPPPEVEVVASQAESAMAAVQEAPLDLGFTSIRAPFEGIAGLASSAACARRVFSRSS